MYINRLLDGANATEHYVTNQEIHDLTWHRLDKLHEAIQVLTADRDGLIKELHALKKRVEILEKDKSV